MLIIVNVSDIAAAAGTAAGTADIITPFTNNVINGNSKHNNNNNHDIITIVTIERELILR